MKEEFKHNQRSMKGRATVPLIILTAFGIISYLSLSIYQRKSVSTPTAEKLAASPPPKLRFAPRPEGGEQVSKSQELPQVIVEAQQAVTRSRMKRAELALRDTPQKHKLAIQGMLEYRRPHFDALFDQWDLPPDTRSSVYDVIRLRLDERRSDSINRSTSFAIGSPERKSSRDEIELRSARQLSEILGKERSVELINLDKRLEDELRQQLLPPAKQ